MSDKKKNGGALLGAAFLMATSAIGPGFLTQTSKFTSDFQASFGFVILISILLAAVAQMNIWRVLCVTGLRGQEVANKVLPGLGYLVSFMVVLGGLVFNIGNVSCCCRSSERTDPSDHSGNLSDRIKEENHYGRNISSSYMASGTWNYCSYYFCLSWNHNLCIKSGKFILSIVRTGKGVVTEAYTFF